MVTMEDLVVINSTSAHHRHRRDIVQYQGRYFIVGSEWLDMDDPEAIDSLDPAAALAWAFGLIPEKDCWVIEAVPDGYGFYRPKNECGPECSEGVCNKRIATAELFDINHAYSMLLAALNA